jgi:DNA-binding NtrC family response regulator
LRSAATPPSNSRDRVVIVTTDERVGPEAETYLAADYDLNVLQTWDELMALIKKGPPEAILLDIDTVGERSEDGIAALAELRSLGPDFVLVGLTRSNRRNLRLKAVDSAVDEYFIAPINFEEVRIVLGRVLEKRAVEIEYRNRHQEDLGQQNCGDLIGTSEPMRRVYDAIRRVSDSGSTVLIRGGKRNREGTGGAGDCFPRLAFG